MRQSFASRWLLGGRLDLWKCWKCAAAARQCGRRRGLIDGVSSAAETHELAVLSARARFLAAWLAKARRQRPRPGRRMPSNDLSKDAFRLHKTHQGRGDLRKVGPSGCKTLARRHRLRSGKIGVLCSLLQGYAAAQALFAHRAAPALRQRRSKGTPRARQPKTAPHKIQSFCRREGCPSSRT